MAGNRESMADMGTVILKIDKYFRRISVQKLLTSLQYLILSKNQNNAF